jgi:hypothetical protein
MGRPQDWIERKMYRAWFEGGPRDATHTAVLGLASGQPPDVLLTPGRPSWIYVLAGGVRPDGTLPYIWMPRNRAAALRQEALTFVERVFPRR